jgi:hypothetical protein
MHRALTLATPSRRPISREVWVFWFLSSTVFSFCVDVGRGFMQGEWGVVPGQASLAPRPRPGGHAHRLIGDSQRHPWSQVCQVLRLNSPSANDVRLTSSAGASRQRAEHGRGGIRCSRRTRVPLGDADVRPRYHCLCEALRDTSVSLRVGDDCGPAATNSSVCLGVTTRAAADSEADGCNAVIAINGAITSAMPMSPARSA